uniref:Secreted protein n=1 Tax=Streptomyces sp. NBC_00003 TaxID=2903608 RepID=A0AAU2V9J9_9ACTN
MTLTPKARTAYGRGLSARWFTAPLVALVLLGAGAGTSIAAPADDTDHQQYVQAEEEPAFTAPSARESELPPYDARDAQQAVDDMVMGEDENAEGQHCPPQNDDSKGRYQRQGPHRDDAYPAETGQDATSGEPQIVG